MIRKIRQLAEELAASQRGLYGAFGEKFANGYFISGVDVDYEDPKDLHNLQRALTYLSEHARFVSAIVEDLGMGLRTVGDCTTEIGKTRETVHLHSVGLVAQGSEKQIDAAREGIKEMIAMIGHRRDEILAAQEDDEGAGDDDE